jgi:hypothetical protein
MPDLVLVSDPTKETGMKKTRLVSSALVAGALATGASTAPASADATLRHPASQAACIAQAWVPANTDPSVPPGSIGQFLSTTKFAAGGGLRQDGGKDC